MAHFQPPDGSRDKPRPGVQAGAPAPGARHVELVCCSNYSFLRGASHPEELVEQAARLGLQALALTDWESLGGVVKAHDAARTAGVKLIVGARLRPAPGAELCLYAMDRRGYGNLCRLLTLGKRRAPKGGCELSPADLPPLAEGLQAVALPGPGAAQILAYLAPHFPGRLSVALWHHLQPGDDALLAGQRELAARCGLPVVAANDVHMHTASRKPLQDVLTCIRHGVPIQQAQGLLFPNAERRLKSAAEMQAVIPAHDPAWSRAQEIADSCRFSLDELRYEYPQEITEDGLSMPDYLRRETLRGAARRYPRGVPEQVSQLITHELDLIAELGYEAYFLTIYDVVRFARGRGILCQGRGSAANSAVCFCLGITSVDPAHFNLLFERFISRERAEPPDIDVDFEHERREEVLQYIYNRYGRERAGLCAAVICYRRRSAIRETGKALGLSLDQVDRLARGRQWFDDDGAIGEVAREAGVDPRDRNVQLAFALAAELRGFPRHLSQHVGGMVITRGRLDELVPIENAAMPDRTVIAWDKDDIDALGILKVDCLSLGMLTAVRKCFAMIEARGGPCLDSAAVLGGEQDGQSPEAAAVYHMLQQADSIGTFQVESRAQMSMLPRLKPACFYDLVIEVAIVRPGPIQGGMVHPYLRRRNGEEPVEYPHPSLEPVLRSTLGVPLFQEQCMKLAVVAAGFTPGEADRLRKAMGGWRRPGLMEQYREKLVQGMRQRGIGQAFAERIYQQIAGFGEYGFPESHAASFALITYVSSYLKRFYPAALTASLLNSQPMGFYSASSLVRDAREHGVTVLPVDINASDWDCTLQPGPGGAYAPAALDAPPGQWGAAGPALRLGLRVVGGLRRDVAEALLQARAQGGPFASPQDLAGRLAQGLNQHWSYSLTRLADAGAFASLGLARREALWAVLGAARPAPGMFAGLAPDALPVSLPAATPEQEMALDYRATGLSLNAHPLQFLRAELQAQGVITARQLSGVDHGRRVEVAGWTLVRQRPGQGKMLFFTLEDETGTANLMLTPKVFDQNRQAALSPHPVVVEGQVEKRDGVIHLRVRRMREFHSAQPQDLSTPSRDFH